MEYSLQTTHTVCVCSSSTQTAGYKIADMALCTNNLVCLSLFPKRRRTFFSAEKVFNNFKPMVFE